MEELKAVLFEKDVLKHRDLSILRAHFAACILSSFRLQKTEQKLKFQKTKSPPHVQGVRLTKKHSIDNLVANAAKSRKLILIELICRD